MLKVSKKIIFQSYLRTCVLKQDQPYLLYKLTMEKFLQKFWQASVMTVDDIITELEHGSYFHPTRMLTIFISSQTLISLFYKTENLYLNRTIQHKKYDRSISGFHSNLRETILQPMAFQNSKKSTGSEDISILKTWSYLSKKSYLSPGLYSNRDI